MFIWQRYAAAHAQRQHTQDRGVVRFSGHLQCHRGLCVRHHPAATAAAAAQPVAAPAADLPHCHVLVVQPGLLGLREQRSKKQLPQLRFLPDQSAAVAAGVSPDVRHHQRAGRAVQRQHVPGARLAERQHPGGRGRLRQKPVLVRHAGAAARAERRRVHHPGGLLPKLQTVQRCRCVDSHADDAQPVAAAADGVHDEARASQHAAVPEQVDWQRQQQPARGAGAQRRLQQHQHGDHGQRQSDHVRTPLAVAARSLAMAPKH